MRSTLVPMCLMMGLFATVAAGCGSTSVSTAEEADDDEADLGTTSSALSPSSSPQIAVAFDQLTFDVEPLPARTVTIVHTAMFDAINSVARKYDSYKYGRRAPRNTSADAAAIQAGYRVLITIHGAVAARATQIEAVKASLLGAIPDGTAKTNGIALGDAVANDALADRAGDNWFLPDPVYVPQPGADKYRPTPPAFVNAVNQNAPLWKPYGLEDPYQFEAGGPPKITKRKFARDYDEVKAVGRACPPPPGAPPGPAHPLTSCAWKTPEQASLAVFSVEQALPQVARAARALAVADGLDLYTAARMFAHLSLASFDATQTVFTQKFVFDFVRPVTAIQNGDADGNDDTVGDPTWQPQLVTPPHPEYPAAHSTISAALVKVMESYFGKKRAFAMTGVAAFGPPGAPPTMVITQTLDFSSFDDYGTELSNARIYAGVHFRSAVEDGGKLGDKVGRHTLRTQLQKRRGHGHGGHGDDCDD